jgi:phosphatidylserine/phosphatidylglycerophosphate/cardiolipin synthase-like enzyme
MLELLRAPTARLDLAIMSLSDPEATDALLARATDTAVRVILAHPSWIERNVQTAAKLAAAGIQVRFLEEPRLHAKLILTDAAAAIGSVNLSWTSLQRNREIGVFVAEPERLEEIAVQFEADWQAAVLATQ